MEFLIGKRNTHISLWCDIEIRISTRLLEWLREENHLLKCTSTTAASANGGSTKRAVNRVNVLF